MLYSLKEGTGHERPKDKSTNKNKKHKLRHNTHPLSPHPHPDINQLPPPHLSHPPIIHNNNTLDTEFLVQMRQSNKCRSVRNDEIFNLHLGSSVGPWVSIPCLLQGTSHIYWFHLPKQIARKRNKEPSNEIQLPTNPIVLPWSRYTKSRAKLACMVFCIYIFNTHFQFILSI